MARTRTPLPRFIGTHAIGTDWKTGDVVQGVTWYKGKLWDPYKLVHDHDGLHYERDRQRVRRHQAVRNFLNSQTTDPGL